jgi:cell division protein FtsW
MAVSLSLVPAKGMTLPFVSYGGSSLISLAFGMGMLIALTRKRSRAESLAELEHAEARESAQRGATA